MNFTLADILRPQVNPVYGVDPAELLRIKKLESEIYKQVDLLYDIVHYYHDVDTQMELFIKLREHCFRRGCGMFSRVFQQLTTEAAHDSRNSLFVFKFVQLLDNNVDNCNTKELKHLNKLKTKYF